MPCDICQRETAHSCLCCATYYCVDHGGSTCIRCAGKLSPFQETGYKMVEVGFYSAQQTANAGERKKYLQCQVRKSIPTIYLNDSAPPCCYECGLLAKNVCRNCEEIYCPEHAGVSGLCQSCTRSSNLGIWVLGIVLAIFLITLLAGQVSISG